MKQPYRNLCAVAFIGTTALALTGCVSVMSGCSTNWGSANFTRTISLSVQPNASSSAGMLDVKTHNGNVTINAGAHAEGATDDVTIDVTIKAKTQLRADETTILAERDANGLLTLRAQWPGGKAKSSEGAKYVINTPTCTGAYIRTSNGSVTIKGSAGDIHIDTSNGAIHVKDHDGSVKADTSNGRVTLEQITSEVEVDTSNGSVGVVLTSDNPGPVNIDTSNGKASLSVGSGFRGTLAYDTSNGSVKTFFADPEAVNVVTRKKTSGSFIVGGSTETTSLVDTSNGSISIIVRSQ